MLGPLRARDEAEGMRCSFRCAPPHLPMPHTVAREPCPLCLRGSACLQDCATLAILTCAMRSAVPIRRALWRPSERASCKVSVRVIVVGVARFQVLPQMVLRDRLSPGLQGLG